MKIHRPISLVLIAILVVGVMGVFASRTSANPLTSQSKSAHTDSGATQVVAVDGTKDTDQVDEQVGDQNGPEDTSGTDPSATAMPVNSSVTNLSAAQPTEQITALPTVQVTGEPTDQPENGTNGNQNETDTVQEQTGDNVQEQAGDQSAPDQNSGNDQGGSETGD